MRSILPKVSIILPVYNGAAYLGKSIESCLQQSYSNIELIVVDDGSVDKSLDIVRSYHDSRIIYIKKEKNAGLPRALNTGFTASTGDFLTWTSADNFYEPDAIKEMVRILNTNRWVSFVYAGFYEIDKDGKVQGTRKIEPPRELSIHNCIGACFLYRRKVYETIGDYSSDVTLAEDYEYWLRVRNKFRMKEIPKYLYYYRSHQDSLSAQFAGEKLRALSEAIRDKHVNVFIRNYVYGRASFRQGNYQEAKKFLLCCILGNIFNKEAWRMMAILFMPQFIVKIVRRIKWRFVDDHEK